MSTQLSFEDYPPTRASAPSTSFEAAEYVWPRTKIMRARIVAHLEEMGGFGATCHEICEALGMKIQTATARLNELMAEGAIVRDGRTRKTPSGCSAKVWTVKKEAQ